MITNKSKMISFLTLATLATASLAFAQTGAAVETEVRVEANTTMPAPPPRPPGIIQRVIGNLEEDRKEIRKEFREGMMDAKADLKQGMMDRRVYMTASGTASGTRPTPVRDFRETVKDLRGDMRDERADMRMDMLKLNATATAAIAAKLGITTEALQAKLASGTTIRELVKGVLTEEEMKALFPRMATPTERKGFLDKPQGFFNSIRARLFGTGKRETNDTNASVEANVEVEAETSDRPIRNFFRRFFNF
jgi:hypothetical protein